MERGNFYRSLSKGTRETCTRTSECMNFLGTIEARTRIPFDARFDHYYRKGLVRNENRGPVTVADEA